MTSFLNRLLDRSMGRGRVVQPLIRSLFPLETAPADASMHHTHRPNNLFRIEAPESHPVRTDAFRAGEPGSAAGVFSAAQFEGVSSAAAKMSLAEMPVLQQQAMEGNRDPHCNQDQYGSLTPGHNGNTIHRDKVAAHSLESRRIEPNRNLNILDVAG